MKMKAPLVAVLCAGLLLPSAEGMAKSKYGYKGGYGHHYKGGYGYHYRHGGIDGDDLLIATGILAGAVVLGSFLSAPRYYAPPPVYYPPPPPPRQCYQDQVYRYLPDGRIQWGTRTTCY
jgi:hypothetical protein